MTGQTKPGRKDSVDGPTNPFLWAAISISIVLIGGCGDFFGTKPTELESKNLLRELETVKISPNRDIPLPEVYRQPPKIIEGIAGEQKDAKLFYFSKYHPVDTLANLINTQYVKQFVGEKNKTFPMVDYNVSTNPATNQMIVRCPTVEDAQQVLKFLEKVDVPPIQIKIDCLISEVYADHTLDWETNVLIQNLFGAKVNLDGTMPGAALRDAVRDSFGINAGYVYQEDKPGHKVSALVDLLVSRGYLKILMNPQLEVVNGQTAKIVTSEHVRLDETTDIDPTGYKRTATRYVDVLDSLEITPRVFADGYIGIESRALIGSKATPEGVAQTPIITTREVVVKENRIRQGESLLIGGIRKTEQRSVVRGVPFFKDIPLIGILFSSKDFEERGKEVMFILTPTISTGGIPNEEMVAEIQRKHTPIQQKDSFVDRLADPMGSGLYTQVVEEEATRAEVRRIKAEMQKAHAERKAKQLEEQLGKATEQMEQEQNRATTAEAASKAAQQAVEAEKAKTAEAEAEKAKSAEEVKKLEDAAKAAQAEAEKLKAEAAAAKEAAAKAKKDAESIIEKQSEGKKDGASAEPKKDAPTSAPSEPKKDAKPPTPPPTPAPPPAEAPKNGS